jgi:hypothetical protein
MGPSTMPRRVWFLLTPSDADSAGTTTVTGVDANSTERTLSGISTTEQRTYYYNLEVYFQPRLLSNVVIMALLLLFKLALLYPTRNVHESRIGLKLNKTHHLDKYADNLYIVFVDKLNTIKEFV